MPDHHQTQNSSLCQFINKNEANLRFSLRNQTILRNLQVDFQQIANRRMHGRIDQLLQLHAMCAKELQQLQTNVENYLQSSAKMVTMMQKNWMEVEHGNGLTLMIYDNVVTCITKIMNFSRKLNIEFQLNNLGEGNSGRQNLFEQFQIEATSMDYATTSERLAHREMLPETLEDRTEHLPHHDLEQTSQHSYPLEEISKNKEIIEDFVYPKLKLSANYQIGETIDVIVAYIKNLDELLFYVLDCESKSNQEVFEVSQSLDLHQYHNLPPANEVFGLVLDKRILRAVRSNVAIYNQERDENVWPCYLLDFGEIVYSKLSDIKYKLTEKQKSIPASALLCQIKATKSKNAMREMLKQMTFEKSTIKIRDILEDRFIVEPWSDGVTENAEATETRVNEELLKSKHTSLISNEASSTPASSSTNQQPQRIFVDNENNSLTSNALKNKKLNTNPFLQSPADNSNSDANKHRVAKGTSKKLTPEELEMLNEEPLNTSNAFKAILGHVPQDDKRICRFYNPSTGACFKGRNCKQEHVPLSPEVWTKDVLTAASIVDKRVPRILYAKGQTLNITPTFIGELGVFYAQVNEGPLNKRPLIWTDENISTRKRLEKPPHVFELVLCRYDDGLWYRAQIVAVDDDFKNFKVFYVDYGNQNVVGMKNLAKCDYELAHIPHQAIRCRLAHLKEKDITVEKRKAGVKMLCSMLLNQPVNVTVLSHPEDLIVMLAGDLNLTIKSKLVHGGYMKPF